MSEYSNVIFLAAILTATSSVAQANVFTGSDDSDGGFMGMILPMGAPSDDAKSAQRSPAVVGKATVSPTETTLHDEITVTSGAPIAEPTESIAPQDPQIVEPSDRPTVE